MNIEYCLLLNSLNWKQKFPQKSFTVSEKDKSFQNIFIFNCKFWGTHKFPPHIKSLFSDHMFYSLFSCFLTTATNKKNFKLSCSRLYWFYFKTLIIYVNRIAYLIVHLRRVWFAPRSIVFRFIFCLFVLMYFTLSMSILYSRVCVSLKRSARKKTNVTTMILLKCYLLLHILNNIYD